MWANSSFNCSIHGDKHFVSACEVATEQAGTYFPVGCRWRCLDERHKSRWSDPARRPLQDSSATSWFPRCESRTSWRNERSPLYVFSSSLWGAEDGVPAKKQHRRKRPRESTHALGRQRGEPQTQQIPRDWESDCSPLSQAQQGTPHVFICINRDCVPR